MSENNNAGLSSNERAVLARLLEKEEKRREYRRKRNQRPDVKAKQALYHKERNERIREQAAKFAELVEAGVIDEEGNAIE